MVPRETKKRILIIEDEKDLADLVSKNLTLEGYEPDIALDGEEGLKKIIETKPDLVLLDLMLPKMDGIEVLEKMKQNQDVKQISVIIMSSRFQQADRDTTIGLGAVDYLEKPYDRYRLLRKIKETIG
jgi:DNA-binding response OmpR family regulator